MAHPITFKPQPVDPRHELLRQLEHAPREHAEALLVLYDVLEAAHDKGVLDLLRAVVGGRDVLAEKLGEGLALPETVAALRNAIALTRLLAAIDPEMLHGLAKSFAESAEPKLERETAQTQAKTAPLSSAQRGSVAAEKPLRPAQPKADDVPSLWQLFRRASSKDARRGLAHMIAGLTTVGRALRPKDLQ